VIRRIETHDEITYGRVSVLPGPRRGAYPYANSLLLRGSDETVLIDPSLGLVDAPPEVDLVLVSHAHEDHLAGLDRYRAPVLSHTDDLPVVQDPELLVAHVNPAPEHAAELRRQVIGEFHVAARPDATGFTDGTRFDLGGCTVTAIHLPGHTRGHCGFLIEPEGLLFVGDIDLTSFGPYYGGLDSDLVDFEASLRICRDLDAGWYATAHQRGVIEGAAAFRERLDAYTSVIDRREGELLEFLTEPRTVEEIVARRLVYRAHVEGPHVDPVERRTATQHLDRLVAAGRVRQVEGRYAAR
jgi:glyoxylase-like metal-dependent hydrolase (beta-lactamase superfamily II)